jgi:hypothetical protein
MAISLVVVPPLHGEAGVMTSAIRFAWLIRQKPAETIEAVPELQTGG